MNLKELRKKKNSIISTRKLTSAMKMVSGAKFARSHAVWNKSLMTIAEITESAGRIYQSYIEKYSELDVAQHLPYLMLDPEISLREESADYEKPPTLFLVLSSDKGLCGGFNGNIIKSAISFIESESSSKNKTDLVCVGNKAASTLQKMFKSSSMISANKNPTDIAKIALELFKERKIKKCVILYSKFHNVIKQTPTIEELLPISMEPHNGGNLTESGLINYIPSVQGAFEATLKTWFFHKINTLFKEHQASEHAARVMAMGNATENADNLIKSLNLRYNTMRQELVTKELIEIISGAEAV